MINEELHSYSSTQINIPSKLSDEIIDWGQKYISNNDLYESPDDPNFGREYEPHVTVLYGLHTEEPDSIKKILQYVKKFEVKLGKISIFNTSDKFDVIKIEIISSELRELNKKISKLPHTNKFPEYKPHATLAYVKKDRCKKLINNNEFEGKSFQCDFIAFSDKNRKKTNIKLKP